MTLLCLVTHHQGQAADPPREADGTGGPGGAGTVTPGMGKNQLNTYVHILREDSQMKVPRGGEIILKKESLLPHTEWMPRRDTKGPGLASELNRQLPAAQGLPLAGQE